MAGSTFPLVMDAPIGQVIKKAAKAAFFIFWKYLGPRALTIMLALFR